MDSWIIQTATAICGIIVVGGITAYFLLTRMVRSFEEIDSRQKKTKDLSKRLADLERRLTDIQDVVISLDDRLKRDSVPTAPPTAMDPDKG